MLNISAHANSPPRFVCSQLVSFPSVGSLTCFLYIYSLQFPVINKHSAVKQIAFIIHISAIILTRLSYLLILDIRGVFQEVWNNVVQVNNLSSFIEHQDFPENPHWTEIIKSFNASLTEPRYGQRLRAHLAVPKSGLYDIHASCKNACVLRVETQHGNTFIRCQNM